MVKDRSNFQAKLPKPKTNVLPNGFTKPEGENYEFVDGDLIIDFNEPSEDDKMELHMKAKNELATNDIDLGSGWPRELVWTTKDGRRIPIPQMADEHLLNTIAFLRRRVESVYKKKAIANLCRGVALTMFVHSRMDLSPEESNFYDERMHKLKGEALAMGERIFAMDADEFLRQHSEQFPHMYQEAYKRKLLLEVDSSKIT